MAIFNRPNNDSPASMAQRLFQFIWTLVSQIRVEGTGVLLGRESAGAGPAEEITIGSGLTLLNGTLSVTGGSQLSHVGNGVLAFNDNGTIRYFLSSSTNPLP